MPEEKRRTMSYRVLRYTPNLIRDEWVNIGLLLEDPAGGRIRTRFIEEPGELGRARRLHTRADENWLRGLQRDWQAQFAAPGLTAEYVMEKLDQSLSNLL